MSPIDGEGSEVEKEALLPKLEGLRKAIGDMTAHYDAKLAEVKERNLQALQELQKLEKRVKAAAAKPPTNKENQENERALALKETEKKKEKVREKKPERFAPLLAPLPRIAPIAYVPWEETVP